MTGNATPATATLVEAGISHRVHSYRHDAGTTKFGSEAADILVTQLGVESAQIFKTLVVRTAQGVLAVAVVPVTAMLSLKAAAAALGTSKVSMAERKQAERSTGYVFGGVSPLGQRKKLATVIDRSALTWDVVLCSGGRRGLEIELDPRDLVLLTGGYVAAIAVDTV